MERADQLATIEAAPHQTKVARRPGYLRYCTAVERVALNRWVQRQLAPPMPSATSPPARSGVLMKALR